MTATRTEYRHDGQLYQVDIDNGDGTGTTTTWENGIEVTTPASFPIIVLSPQEQFAALAPGQAEAVLTVALGLVSQAGELWDALTAIPSDDPSKPSLDIITSVALEAALPLVS